MGGQKGFPPLLHGGGSRFLYWCCCCLLVVILASVRSASADVVLVIGNNRTLSFPDVNANFAPAVEGDGENGALVVADPLDACIPLRKSADVGGAPAFALIIRGTCQFDEKVRNAQDAGFKAAIVYDNEYSTDIFAMYGDPSGIVTYAVFVSKATGELLKQYAGLPDVVVWITPAVGYSRWSMLAIVAMSLIAVSAVLCMCSLAHRHIIATQLSANLMTGESHGMGSQLVKAMPSITFTTASEGDCTSSTCAICLDDYTPGDKLRILPCRHKFHTACVDMWLTSWRVFCPICKRDARVGTYKSPPSECTPLLAGGDLDSLRHPSPLSSFHSSDHSLSPAIQMLPASPRPPASPSPSLSNALHSPLQRRPYINSPIHVSRSLADFRTLASQRSPSSNHLSPQPLGMPVSFRMTSRFNSPNGYSPANSPPSYIGHGYLRHSESARNFQVQASAESLAMASRFNSTYGFSPTNSPQNHLGHRLLRHSESASNFQAQASAESLPMASRFNSNHVFSPANSPPRYLGRRYLQHSSSARNFQLQASAESLPEC